MFRRTSSHRNNPALKGSQLWSTNLPRQMTPKCIALESTQPGCGRDSQWFSSRDRRGSLQRLSRFPQEHPPATQKEGNCVTGHWSRVTTFKSPVEQKDSHTICYGTTLPGEGTACGARAWVRKEEQWGTFCHWFCHALLACQVCLTFGFSPG